MADPESSEAAPDDKPTVAPDYSANALRREPATIEGKAEDLTAPESEAVHEPAEEPETELGHLPPEPTAAEHPFDPLPDSETAPDISSETPAPPAEATKRRGGVLAPALLALIIGGAAGFGGAYGLRVLDKSDTKFDLLGERVDALEQQQKGRRRADDGAGRPCQPRHGDRNASPRRFCGLRDFARRYRKADNTKTRSGFRQRAR